MEQQYQSLQFKKVINETSMYQPYHMLESSVRLDDAAFVVMTDFKRTTPISIESTASIEAANAKMIACGVRLLFVCDHDHVVTGLITANDILGERPVKYLKEHGGTRADILVLDIMTRKELLDSVQIADVARFRVGDVVETFKSSGRQHVLVTDEWESKMSIRGLFSLTQVSRQLGMVINLNDRANTFAEIEHAIAASF